MAYELILLRFNIEYTVQGLSTVSNSFGSLFITAACAT